MVAQAHGRRRAVAFARSTGSASPSARARSPACASASPSPRGSALALERPVRRRRHAGGAGGRTPATASWPPCIDARRGQVYLQAFDRGRALMAPDVLAVETAAARAGRALEPAARPRWSAPARPCSPASCRRARLLERAAPDPPPSPCLAARGRAALSAAPAALSARARRRAWPRHEAGSRRRAATRPADGRGPCARASTSAWTRRRHRRPAGRPRRLRPRGARPGPRGCAAFVLARASPARPRC